MTRDFVAVRKSSIENCTLHNLTVHRPVYMLLKTPGTYPLSHSKLGVWLRAMEIKSNDALSPYANLTEQISRDSRRDFDKNPGHFALIRHAIQ